MTRRKTALLITAALMLSACGIKGDLDTAPPLWGDASDAQAPETTTTTESVDAQREPFGDPEDPFDRDVDEFGDTRPGYGVGVAD